MGLLKIQKKIRKLRRPIDPTIHSTQGQTGPQNLPHNTIDNALNNGNKAAGKNPLDLLKKNPIMDTLRKRAVKKPDLRSRIYK